jgi:preprotein translocase subunit SecD
VAPPQGPPHPGRQLIALGVIFVILYSIVWFGGSGSWHKRLEPKLGLDLIGGTQVTLQAKTLDGKPPPADNLERARQIIENRVNGLGVSEAQVVTEGQSNITVSLAGKSDDRLKQIGSPAQLRFRTVLNSTTDTPDTDASPSAGPSSSASPSASSSASAKASASASASASKSAAPSASASGSAGAAGASPSASAPPVSQNIQQVRAEAEAKVGGAAWQAASALTAPADFTQQADLQQSLAPFKQLTADQVAALPAQMQYNVPYVNCAKLNNRVAGSIVDANQQAVACDSGGQKYLLDVAKVVGTDVKGADASIDSTNGQWQVVLSFNGAGQNKWTQLTKEAYGDGTNKKQVAVVLDNTVVSAPTIQSVIPGDATITGSFTSSQASLLASQLRYGALPLTFIEQEAQSVSATLGTAQLKAGLLAAGIGMLLVIIYAFFYYRLLGSVIFLSLVLSALLVFGALIVLGRQAGLTLTLAGIAGFIVSLGVAADSFVIYFERLKDEIREGRSPRSAVSRAWVRARRTIITANTISILAAVVLFIFSVGTVKGFAFALGLATFLDLVVVFLFRHPVMTMFANTRAFLSPRVSGLGRVLKNQSGEAGVKPRASRVKEA